MSSQPPHDRHAAAGRAKAPMARQYANQQAGAARLLVKLITLPFWMPFRLVSRLIERRQIRAFIIEKAPDQPITSVLVNDLTIAWAEANPQRYPHGRYDRNFSRLKTRFESSARILQHRRGY